MRQIRRLLLLFALAATVLGVAQQNQSATGAPQSTAAQLNPGSPVRILTPTPGQTITGDYVDLRYELARPALSGEPNFQVQLDTKDPINTTEYSNTFSDVEPGSHTIRVTLVDANNVPIEGGTATVNFKVQSQQPPSGGGPGGARPRSAGRSPTNASIAARTLAGAAPAAPIPPELRNDGDPHLPLAGSPLPLLSLIGFGLLIGGAAQAMRSR